MQTKVGRASWTLDIHGAAKTLAHLTLVGEGKLLCEVGAALSEYFLLNRTFLDGVCNLSRLDPALQYSTSDSLARPEARSSNLAENRCSASLGTAITGLLSVLIASAPNFMSGIAARTCCRR